jgi:hypothetical protein
MTEQTNRNTDIREALYNDRLVGPAPRIQRPREGAGTLWGLLVDLDADLLKPNPWFPPADTAEAFYTAIRPALGRHEVLRHAEIRDSGRWLHAIIYFAEPVELKTAREQERWTALHRVLIGSVPADPSAPALIALSRPVGSLNGKTGRPVRVLKAADEIPASILIEWSEEVNRKPFLTLGRTLFGDQRVSPCPYCQTQGSHLDLGDVVAYCYGPCRQVRLARLHEPFLAASRAGMGAGGTAAEGEAPGNKSPKRRKKRATPAEAPALPVIPTGQDAVLEIHPGRVGALTIRFRRSAETDGGEA